MIPPSRVTRAVPIQDVEHASEHSRAALKLVALDLLRLHRRRDRLMGGDADLCGDPAWDLILDLYVQDGRRSVSVSSACIAAAAPATTALRYISKLEKQGLVVRSPDPEDRRRTFLHLSVRMIESIELLLSDYVRGRRSDVGYNFRDPYLDRTKEGYIRVV